MIRWLLNLFRVRPTMAQAKKAAWSPDAQIDGLSRAHVHRWREADPHRLRLVKRG